MKRQGARGRRMVRIAQLVVTLEAASFVCGLWVKGHAQGGGSLTADERDDEREGQESSMHNSRHLARRHSQRRKGSPVRVWWWWDWRVMVVLAALGARLRRAFCGESTAKR